MTSLRLNILTFFLLVFLQTSGQEVQVFFKLADSIVMTENSATKLYAQLDNLKSKFIPSRSSLSTYFDRDIDFGYRHQRINIQLNFHWYQIDLLKRNDSIFVKVIKDYHNPAEIDTTTKYFNAESAMNFDYLTLRNKFYYSNKSISDLTSEISKYQVFAFYCGMGSSKTGDGIHIEKLVDNKNVSELTKMLQSICIETQAYAISGFEMLAQHKFQTNAATQAIINHVKKRNSETIICNGCLTGLIKKVYGSKKASR
ncbi:MAG: hypothetical protein JWR61_1127 [Ferruginibacter sp.]|uniref:hypothetical protein n=1 Tax=Ferruginibacter sp. TaxID=1940288 RepID=UPI00265943D8|nr:hypothetical protein [Ferruginibacter sp.]MDB5276172.1 hypothetical protein [Ferruginibacter sp.]